MEDKIIKALKTRPHGELKADFAQNVLIKIRKREAEIERRNMFVLAIGVLAFLASSALTLIFLVDLSKLPDLMGYAKWTVLGLGLFAIIQLLDAKFVLKRKVPI
ncbi:MAG: hypothetical protein ABJN36_01385 [Cyclobacteriaceae bacterium]